MTTSLPHYKGIRIRPDGMHLYQADVIEKVIITNKKIKLKIKKHKINI